MTVPGWYALIILGLGVFRLCRLIGWDEITAPLRPRLVGLTDEEHSQWTFVMNTLTSAGFDPWEYRYTYRDSGDLIAHVSQVTGQRNPVPIPPLVAERLFWDSTPREMERPNQRIVPFTKTEWYVSKLIRCPWCLGFWLSLIAWLGYQAWPHGMMACMSLFALAALPGLITKNLDHD